MNNTFKEYRCACGKLLFKGSLISAVVEIKCKRCEKVSLFEENFSKEIIPHLEVEINTVES